MTIDPGSADLETTIQGFPVLIKVTSFDVPANHPAQRLPANHPDAAEDPSWDIHMTNGSPAPAFVHRKLTPADECRINHELRQVA